MVNALVNEVASPFTDLWNRINRSRIGGFWLITILIGLLVVLITFAIQAFIFKTANKINSKFAKKLGISLEDPRLLHDTYLVGDINSEGMVSNIKNSEITLIGPNLFKLNGPGLYLVSYSFVPDFPGNAYLELNEQKIASANMSADSTEMNRTELFITSKKKQVISFIITNSRPVRGKFRLIYLGNL